MQSQLSKILQEAKEQLKKASTMTETEEIRVKVLGKKGQLTEILRSWAPFLLKKEKRSGRKQTM